jgi:hypothetical protein
MDRGPHEVRDPSRRRPRTRRWARQQRSACRMSPGVWAVPPLGRRVREVTGAPWAQASRLRSSTTGGDACRHDGFPSTGSALGSDDDPSASSGPAGLGSPPASCPMPGWDLWDQSGAEPDARLHQRTRPTHTGAPAPQSAFGNRRSEISPPFHLHLHLHSLPSCAALPHGIRWHRAGGGATRECVTRPTNSPTENRGAR